MNRFEGDPKSVDKTTEERNYRRIFADEFLHKDQQEKDPLKFVDQLEQSGKITAEEAEKIRAELAQEIEAGEEKTETLNEVEKELPSSFEKIPEELRSELIQNNILRIIKNGEVESVSLEDTEATITLSVQVPTSHGSTSAKTTVHFTRSDKNSPWSFERIEEGDVLLA